MGKHLILIFLTTLILGVSFQDTLTYITFKLNEEFIAANLCINKEVDSSCHGHCQLVKEYENDNQEAKKNYLKIDERLFQNYISVSTNLPTKQFHLDRNNKFIYKELYSYSISESIFHPPKV